MSNNQQTDKLVEYLRQQFLEADFDQDIGDDMYCSDSNRSLNPTEMAKEIRKILSNE
jgi:hypothetical protein